MHAHAQELWDTFSNTWAEMETYKPAYERMKQLEEEDERRGGWPNGEVVFVPARAGFLTMVGLDGNDDESIGDVLRPILVEGGEVQTI